MKDSLRLKKNIEFKRVYNNGKSFANAHLVMFLAKNGTKLNKVGFSVSKKVGKSVTRNKVRRKLKEIYRLNDNTLKHGYNIVFLARVRAKEADYHTLEKSMIKLFNKAELLKKV